ncbi:MAG: hypothetical protein V4557_08200 [Bacteroidota bacterium]
MKSPDNTNINNLEDLHAEMRRVKQSIRERERDLGERWNRLPEEAVKASVTAVLPAFMSNQVASGVWKLVKGVYDFFKGNENGEAGAEVKNTLAGGIKQVGLFSILKLLFSMWKGK